MNTILATSFPEEKGLSRFCIINALKEIDQKGISMHSFLMWKDGSLITVGYYAPIRQTDLHRMFSVTKSFVSIAIGLLQEEGRLSINDPIVKFFPEYVPDPKLAHPWLRQMTIRNMLSMRSCHATTTYDKFSSKTDWVESFFTVPPTHKPGTVFHYDTSSTHTLCALVEKLTGMKLLDYLRSKVLDEIGFSKEAYCLTDGFGVSMGGSGLMATSRDLMLFALLILNNGKLNGKQYIPADYIKEATSFQTATCVTGPVPAESKGYGWQFWVGEHDSVLCYGMGGQLAILLPKWNTAIVTTADTQGYQGGNQVIYDAIFRHILPELEKKKVPWTPTDKEKSEYQSFIKSLCIRPLNNSTEKVNDINRIFSESFRQIMSSFAGTYVIEKNIDSENTGKKNSITANSLWEQISFEFNTLGSGTGQVTFKSTQPSKTEQVTFKFTQPVGTGQMALKCHIPPSPLASGTLTMTTHMGNRADEPVPVSMRYAASATWLDQNSLYILVHLLDTSVGKIHIQAVFGESDVTVFLRKQEETLFGEFSGHLYGIRMSKFNQI